MLVRKVIYKFINVIYIVLVGYNMIFGQRNFFVTYALLLKNLKISPENCGTGGCLVKTNSSVAVMAYRASEKASTKPEIYSGG